MHKFRLKPVIASLLCLVFAPAFAEGESPLQKASSSPSGEQPIFISADILQGHQDQDFEAMGHARLSKGEQSIVADWLKYLKASDEIEAKGHVSIEQNGNVVTGTELKLQINSNVGFMEKPQYKLKETGGRGYADLLQFAGKDKYKLHNAVYTTCPVGNDDWLLKVSELDLDQATQVGIAHDASINFKGKSILYMPWLDFPTGNQRRSGFLAPIFGSTASSGEEIIAPYYWSIAPNMDATISPTLFAKRGAMLGNEFRYLEPNYSGEVHFNIMPKDNITGTTRDEMRLTHNQNFGNGWSGELNLQRVSDSYYYLDLSPLVTMTSQTVLPREGHLTYNGGWWNFTSRVQNYQTLSNPFIPVIAPYASLPQLLLNASKDEIAGMDVALNAEYDDFSHPVFVNGKRLVLNPTVSFPMRNSAAFFVPKVGLHAASYMLGANNTQNLPSSSITIPYASLDSGLYFERDNPLGRQGLTQTLEPRIYYVYVPYRNQNYLPNFDSAPMDFTYAQMFTENQFSGNDRFSDANQLTLAVTSRFIDQKTGDERLRMTLGQRLYLQSPQLIPVTTSTSDVIASLGGSLSKTISLDSYFEYNPSNWKTQFASMYIHYAPEIGKLINLGYLYNGTILPLSLYAYGNPATAALTSVLPAAIQAQGYALNQVDLSGQWPLAKHWNGVGRWNYSFANKQLLDGTAGVEYDSDCWALRVVMKRFAVAYQMTTTAFFVQLELDGMARIGSDPLQALRMSIPGYTKTNIQSD
jgi:LPS-assembly protein